MNAPLRLGRPEALDTAIELAKRLDEASGASLVGIESTTESTTVHLSIPADGLPGMRRTRRRLWTSFVARNVASRRALLVQTARASARRQSSIVEAAWRTARGERILDEPDRAER